MVETLISTLILIGVVALFVYVAIWALGQFGLALPTRVVQIVWAIAVLIIVLILWQAFGSRLPGI